MKPSNLILIIALMIIAVLTVFSFFLPYRIGSNYSCVYCGAIKYKDTVLFFATSTRVSETALSKYWRTSVEPSCNHIWNPWYSNRYYIMRGGHGDNFRWPGSWLNEEAEIAVLGSLPTPLDRKMLIDKLWNDWNSTNPTKHNAAEKTLDELKYTYLENPNHKDWNIILKKHGYLP